MMTKRFILGLALAAVVAMTGCGGGGESSVNGGTQPPGGGSPPPAGGPLPSKMLSWTPPSAYTDNSQLDPARDLAYIEVYVNQDGVFSAGDTETASVAAVDPVTRQIVTSFDLANLGSFVSRGVTYYVSVRAVAISGLKSDFSAAATFSF